MMGRSRHRLPADHSTEVQTLRDLFAQSPTFRDAVLADPILGPEGAVVIDVHCNQETAFRAVAPTAEEAYALLVELVGPLVDRARRRSPSTRPS